MDLLPDTGPMTAGRTAVAPLEVTAQATMAAAAALRRRFRGWIGVLADDDTADDLALAVYEALANVVDHAYLGHDVPGEMTLTALASSPPAGGLLLDVTVSDRGSWRECGDPGWRGRGLPLMRRLAESTAVMTDAHGTTVTLRRRVPPPSST